MSNMSDYAKQAHLFIKQIDSAVNERGCDKVVVVYHKPVAYHAHFDPINYVPRFNLGHSSIVVLSGELDKLFKHPAFGLDRESEYFVIWDRYLNNRVDTNIKVSRQNLHPNILLWSMATTRVWSRTQFLQLEVALDHGMNESDREKLLLTKDEVWAQFSKTVPGTSRYGFDEAFDRLSDTSKIKIPSGAVASKVRLQTDVQCFLLSDISLQCGGVDKSLEFLRRCRQISLAKAIGPRT